MKKLPRELARVYGPFVSCLRELLTRLVGTESLSARDTRTIVAEWNLFQTHYEKCDARASRS